MAQTEAKARDRSSKSSQGNKSGGHQRRPSSGAGPEPSAATGRRRGVGWVGVAVDLDERV